MTRFARAVADTERRLATFDYTRLYKAGARLARTGHDGEPQRGRSSLGVRLYAYLHDNNITGKSAAAVVDGYRDEMAKPKAQRRGRLGAY